MKKTQLFLTTLIIVLFIVSVKAQKVNESPEKCVSQGKFIIDAYYGYPYVMGTYIKEANTNSSYVTSEKVVNYNHVGGKVEYMINDMVGMGVDYTYAKVLYSYLDSYYTTVNGQTVINYSKFNESLTKQRFLLRVNVHFATTAELDPYATAGVGYKQTIFKTDNPANSAYDLSFFNAFPVAFRVGAGLRWFFTNNIGVSIEAGIGGPAIQGGLSAKF